MKLLLKILKKSGDYSGDDVEILFETYIKYREQYKLRVHPEDNDFFESYILQGNKFIGGVIRTPSQKRLINAKRFIEKYLSLYTSENLVKWKVVVVLYHTREKFSQNLSYVYNRERR